MGQMAAGRVAMQTLSPEELHGRDRRQHAVVPGSIPDRPAHRQHGFGLQEHGPLAGQALQDGGDVWNHLVASSTMGVVTPYIQERLGPSYHPCNPSLSSVSTANFMPFGQEPEIVQIRGVNERT
jgi:hypothetical protein